jgi:D-proline reductase (dithiol) PrdB
VSLIANYLEANGIPTVVMGCGKDIVEYCGVPRFLYSDFPLGCPAGRPNDPDSQSAALEWALHTLETAPGPRTTVQFPEPWRDNPDWKLDFFNVETMSPETFERNRLEELAWRSPPPKPAAK